MIGDNKRGYEIDGFTEIFRDIANIPDVKGLMCICDATHGWN